MDIISELLNRLQNKINEIDSNNSASIYNKNGKIEVKSILYKYNILGEVSYDDLLDFDDEDIKTIFNLVYPSDNKVYDKFLSNKEIIVGFRNISASITGVFEPKQYSASVDYLNTLSNDINDFVGDEDVTVLSSDLYKKYLGMFKLNELKEPVTDIDEFSELLEGLEFTSNQAGEIKYRIGLFNIKLLTRDDSKEVSSIEKYKNILKTSSEIYEDIIRIIKVEKLDLSDYEKLLGELCSKYSLDLIVARKSVGCILLEKKIKEYEDVATNESMPIKIKSNYLHSLTQDMNEIVNEMNKRSITNVIIQNSSISKDAENVLEEARGIIDLNTDLIGSVSASELNEHLIDVVDSNSAETIKYRIISVVTAIYTEVQKCNNFKDTPSVFNKSINDVKEYIVAYKTLKSMEKAQEEKTMARR